MSDDVIVLISPNQKLQGLFKHALLYISVKSIFISRPSRSSVTHMSYVNLLRLLKMCEIKMTKCHVTIKKYIDILGQILYFRKMLKETKGYRRKYV